MSRHSAHPPARPLRPSLRRAATFLVALVAGLSWAVGPAGTMAQASGGYVPTVQTTCGARLSITDGRLHAVVGAGTPGNVPASGTVEVTFSQDDRVLDRVVVPYRGERTVVDGPRATDTSATYGVTMRFTPDDDGVMSSCSAATSDSYDVLAGTGTADPDGDEGVVAGDSGTVEGTQGDVAGDNGLLPDTGGPALWALLLGLGLVAVGIPLLLRRRRTQA